MQCLGSIWLGRQHWVDEAKGSHAVSSRRGRGTTHVTDQSLPSGKSADEHRDRRTASRAENCVRWARCRRRTLDVRGFTPRDILTGQVVELIAKRGTSVSLSERRHVRFPSVLLQPLGHLSVFRINGLRAARTSLSQNAPSNPTFGDRLLYSVVYGRPTKSSANCVRPADVVRSLTGARFILLVPL